MWLINLSLVAMSFVCMVIFKISKWAIYTTTTTTTTTTTITIFLLSFNLFTIRNDWPAGS